MSQLSACYLTQRLYTRLATTSGLAVYEICKLGFLQLEQNGLGLNQFEACGEAGIVLQEYSNTACQQLTVTCVCNAHLSEHSCLLCLLTYILMCTCSIRQPL